MRPPRKSRPLVTCRSSEALTFDDARVAIGMDGWFFPMSNLSGVVVGIQLSRVDDGGDVNKDFLDLFKDHLGGSVLKAKFTIKDSGKCAKTWRWSVSGQQAIAVLRSVGPPPTKEHQWFNVMVNVERCMFDGVKGRKPPCVWEARASWARDHCIVSTDAWKQGLGSSDPAAASTAEDYYHGTMKATWGSTCSKFCRSLGVVMAMDGSSSVRPPKKGFDVIVAFHQKNAAWLRGLARRIDECIPDAGRGNAANLAAIHVKSETTGQKVLRCYALAYTGENAKVLARAIWKFCRFKAKKMFHCGFGNRAYGHVADGPGVWNEEVYELCLYEKRNWHQWDYEHSEHEE